MSSIATVEQIGYILSLAAQICLSFHHTKIIIHSKELLKGALTTCLTFIPLIVSTIGYIISRNNYAADCLYGLAIGESCYVIAITNMVWYQLWRYFRFSEETKHKYVIWKPIWYCYLVIMWFVGFGIIVVYTNIVLTTTIQLKQGIKVQSDCIDTLNVDNELYRMSDFSDYTYFIWEFVVILVYFISFFIFIITHKEHCSDVTRIKIRNNTIKILVLAATHQLCVGITAFVFSTTKMGLEFHLLHPWNLFASSLIMYLMHHQAFPCLCIYNRGLIHYQETTEQTGETNNSSQTIYPHSHGSSEAALGSKTETGSTNQNSEHSKQQYGILIQQNSSTLL